MRPRTFLGGRTLGPWIAAMSAEASDMSGWLLMGLPGVAYWCGLADAAWTSIGLAVGTYLNWLLVSKRLRRYSAVTDNAITIPDYFSNRFHDERKILMNIAAIFILVFFTVYAASCFVTCGKLFNALFGFSYHGMMIARAVFVIMYTFLGDFSPRAHRIHAGRGDDCGAGRCWPFPPPRAVRLDYRKCQGHTRFLGFLQDRAARTGKRRATGRGSRRFSEPAGITGADDRIDPFMGPHGYFGMPQVLLRFMAIGKVDDLKKSRRLAVTWAVICMFAAVMIGIAGRGLYPGSLATSGAAENVFILMSSKLLPPLLAGLAMAGILAATISSSDSYLLIAASAFSKNIFQGLLKKDAADRQVMMVSRVTLLAITVTGVIIAMDETSVIFRVVSFAWAGFGATFGPIMLFSLFWKRTTIQGAVAGMLSGGISVFIWKLVLRPLGGVFGLYELGLHSWFHAYS